MMKENKTNFKKEQVFENGEKTIVIHSAGKKMVTFTIATIVGWSRQDTFRVPLEEFAELIRTGRFELGG